MARYDNNNNPYSWMPDFLRRFLNLSYDEAQSPGSSQGPSQVSSSYAPPSVAAPSAPWSSPGESTFKASSMEGYRAPAGAAPAPSYSLPAAPAPRTPTNGANVITNTGVPSVQRDGYIQPVTYLLRGFLHGALPPQGLEAFTKEARAATTNVWNLYSHWFRFETEEVFQLGRAALTAVTDSITSGAPSPASAPARRIKVTVANGNGNGHASTESAADAANSAS